MIGVYDYTVILTYTSLVSACIGIAASLTNGGHPYLGAIFLLVCAVCDAFDGKVARSKKDRTQMEKSFGIQLDSLADIVAFGVLPAAMGYAMFQNSVFFGKLMAKDSILWHYVLRVIVCAILVCYVLAALIRLAYFNVTEEERQQTEGGKRKFYIGVPVTVSSFTFSLVMAIDILIPLDAAPLYIVAVAVMSFAFVANVKVPKFGFKGISVMVGIGLIEIAVLVALKMIFRF